MSTHSSQFHTSTTSPNSPMDLDNSITTGGAPSAFNYVLSFLLVGVAWGFTTPFIRRAAADFTTRQRNNAAHTHSRSQTQHPAQLGSEDAGEEQELLSGDKRESEGVRKRRGSQRQGVDADASTEETKHTSECKQPQQSWLRAQLLSLFWTVVNLLRTPAYSVPLVVNLTGSVWFFLLVGKHGTVLSSNYDSGLS